MSNNIGDREELLTCPYNESHRVMRFRLTTHLMKCAKSNPHIKLEMCPYNASHRIKAQDKQHHLNNCPDRVAVERDMIRMNPSLCSGRGGNLNVPTYHGNYRSEENWETDETMEPFDPMKNIDKCTFVNSVVLSNMTPLQKREFHASLSKKHGSSDEGEDNGQRPKRRSPSPPTSPPVVIPKLKEMRTPHEQPKVMQGGGSGINGFSNYGSLGRGYPPAVLGSGGRGRLAANIYNTTDSDSSIRASSTLPTTTNSSGSGQPRVRPMPIGRGVTRNLRNAAVPPVGRPKAVDQVEGNAAPNVKREPEYE